MDIAVALSGILFRVMFFGALFVLGKLLYDHLTRR